MLDGDFLGNYALFVGIRVSELIECIEKSFPDAGFWYGPSGHDEVSRWSRTGSMLRKPDT
jgi:hypothetical protein